MVNGGLKIVFNIVYVVTMSKWMEAGSLSRAVVEVKLSDFAWKIRSLHGGAMGEFDRTKDWIQAYYVELEQIILL